MVDAGLTTPLPTSIKKCIQFDKRFGSKQMNAVFRVALPGLFAWLARINPQVMTVPNEPDDVGVPLEDIEWPYRPVSFNRTKITAFMEPEHPTGEYYLGKTNSGRPWSERVIHLGMFSILCKIGRPLIVSSSYDDCYQ